MEKQVFMPLNRNVNIFAALLFLVLMSGCTESKYSELIKSEMAKGVVHDSLLFGMKFGQTKQEFFNRCWKLNQQRLVTQSTESKFLRYLRPVKKGGDNSNAITMLFYGSFNEENIMTGMDLQFYHEGWSLWNKELQSDQLIYGVKELLTAWFPGNNFIIVKRDNIEIFVKVDGNRRIIIKPLDDERQVKAKIDDLNYVLEN